MAGEDTVLKLARGLLRVFLVANFVGVAGFLVALPLTVVFQPAIEAHLLAKYGARLDMLGAMLALRLFMLSSVPSGVALHMVFSRLLKIVATVRDGDPFTAANAARLQTIGWALLALQIFDLLLGAFTAWFAALHVDSAGWTPALGGWISVVMVFVLARVFKRGAAMRDDLAMTV